MKYDSEKYTKGSLSKSYVRVRSSALYEYILETRSGMFLEPIEYVYEAYDKEHQEGVDSMLEYISHV